MIALMLVAGMNTGRRVWEGADQRQSAAEAVDAAQAALRDRIEQLYPATLYDRSPPYVDFQGRPDGMTFLSSPPEAGRPAPLRRYSLILDMAGNLELGSISDVAPAGRATTTREVLLAGARGLDIAYFGAREGDVGEAWRSSWAGEATPPELIRIRVALAPDDHRRWPDLVVRPRADIDAACLLNPVTHHCKGRL
jgi:general secretion pathway protein J